MTKYVLIVGVLVLLAYRFLFNVPEEDYGQYTGPEQSAPQLSGDEIIGHMRVFLKSSSYTAGHGFVLDHGSEKYVVSASHIVNNPKDVDSIDVLFDTVVLVENAKPASGTSRSTCSMSDASNDISFYSLDSSVYRGVLSIANDLPQAGQKVWMFCTKHAKGKERALVPAIVTRSSNRALKYDFVSNTNFRGTSGCPIVNSEMRIVGVNVCGNSQSGTAVPVPSILDNLDSI